MDSVPRWLGEDATFALSSLRKKGCDRQRLIEMLVVLRAVDTSLRTGNGAFMTLRGKKRLFKVMPKKEFKRTLEAMDAALKCLKLTTNYPLFQGGSTLLSLVLRCRTLVANQSELVHPIKARALFRASLVEEVKSCTGEFCDGLVAELLDSTLASGCTKAAQKQWRRRSKKVLTKIKDRGKSVAEAQRLANTKAALIGLELEPLNRQPGKNR